MRNLLKRRPRDETKPSLRERFAATKAKYTRTLAVHRAMNAPPPEKPVADRTALVCYATWLDIERSRVCHDLYPHLGPRARAFRVGLNAGEDWHFNAPDAHGGEADRGPISVRAIKVLDLVGVDWRGDKAKGRGPDDVAGDLAKDTGERPPLPHGWPATDAALIEALDDLTRVDAAQTAMLAAGPGDRDVDTIPGYGDLEEARDDALARLGKVRAEGLTGLQAKAKALLTNGVAGSICEASLVITESLARDLLIATGHTVEPRPDPIFAAIEETWRLTREHGRLLDICAGEPDSHPTRPPERKAHAAMWSYVRDVLLDTVPTTAAGCRALARFAVEFTKDQGVPLDYDHDNDPVLALIARSPLL